MPITDALNATIIALPAPLEPIIQSIRSVISTVSWIVGGIFGLYFIFLFLRWWQNRLFIKVLKDIRFDLNRLNEHFKVKYKKTKKKSKFKKLISKLWEK